MSAVVYRPVGTFLMTNYNLRNDDLRKIAISPIKQKTIMIEPETFLSLFHIKHEKGISILTPDTCALQQIHQIWRSGTLNFGHFLSYALQLAQQGKINRQLRFSDGAQGYWDTFLIREGLYLNVYNKLNWQIDQVKFADSSFCSLQLQFAGHSVEKINSEKLEQGGECLFINSNCRLKFQLFSDAPKELVKIYVSYSRQYLEDQLNRFDFESDDRHDVSFHRFIPTPKIHQFGNRIVNLEPSLTTVLRAEALALVLIAEALDETHSLTHQEQSASHFSLRKSDVSALESAREILDKEFHNTITLESVARKVGINRKKLNDGFQLLNGTTFGEFLLRRRMKEASRLLKLGHMTADIADRTGYSNRSAFSGAFKRYFGCSPKQYLNQTQ